MVVYEQEHGVYPPTLAEVAVDSGMEPNSGLWVSPRGAGERRYDYEDGWIPDRLLGVEPKAPPPIEPETPEDLIDGDYLYLPPERGSNPDTVILMTRPGLLFKRQLNVVRILSYEFETMTFEEWVADAEVRGFLERRGIELVEE